MRAREKKDSQFIYCLPATWANALMVSIGKVRLNFICWLVNGSSREKYIYNSELFRLIVVHHFINVPEALNAHVNDS